MCPFNSSEDPNKFQISYVPWAKAQLQAIVKAFPKVTKRLRPLRIVSCWNYFLPKGESNSRIWQQQSIQPTKWPKWSFDIFYLLHFWWHYSGIWGHCSQLPLMDQLPSSLWAKSSTNIGRIHSKSPIKIQSDPSKPLPELINILKKKIKTFNTSSI